MELSNRVSDFSGSRNTTFSGSVSVFCKGDVAATSVSLMEALMAEKRKAPLAPQDARMLAAASRRR